MSIGGACADDMGTSLAQLLVTADRNMPVSYTHLDVYKRQE